MSHQPLDATNLVVLSGSLSGPPRTRALPSGSVVVEFDVTTRSDSGALSVPVAWFDPGERSAVLAEGGPVAVAGFVRRRFFRAGGATQSRTEVVALRVADGARSRSVARLVAEAATLLAAPRGSGSSPDQRMRKPARRSPSGAGSSTTSTSVTSARGGPARHHDTS